MPHALIIDDNHSNVSVLAMLLKNEGFTSTALTDPAHLSVVLQEVEGAIDVVFLDLEFPDAHGFDLLPRLKAQPILAGVPIVAYSVHISEMQAARQRGFDGFLGKPLDSFAFGGQLRRILNGEAVWEVIS